MIDCSIPFFVAAPTTTLDANLAAGSDITIEHRAASEVTHFQGKQVAPDGIDVSPMLCDKDTAVCAECQQVAPNGIDASASICDVGFLSAQEHAHICSLVTHFPCKQFDPDAIDVNC